MVSCLDEKDDSPLFEAKPAGRERSCRRLAIGSTILGILLILVYRWTHIPTGGKLERFVWIGMFISEIWFGFYYVLTQACCWNPLYYSTFKDRLSHRFEKELPAIDIFVCTADSIMEPPILVVNTILSAMAMDYPQQKLAIFLSDDGASKLMFYGLLEAIEFSKQWIPFCKEFSIQQRSPSAYFSTISVENAGLMDTNNDEITAIRKMYKEMEERIQNAENKNNTHPNHLLSLLQRKGFVDWKFVSSNPNDHRTVLQILNDGRELEQVDDQGSSLPTVVYLAREKSPNHFHNFKAGALNALIRVSSGITNAPIILTLDCDMTVNNSEIAREALCILMDKTGDDVGYVQFPQNFRNTTKNNIYGDFIDISSKFDLQGMNALGGPLYIGTGCFFRRCSIIGKKYVGDSSDLLQWRKEGGIVNTDERISMLEQKSRVYASCTYEQNTLWGKEMGVKYGVIVEDALTGLSIQCNGWKSVWLSPERKGLMGIAPITLTQILVQRKRWSEGWFQIFLSRYNPFLYGNGKIGILLQMAYSSYYLWAPFSVVFLFYVLLSSFALLKGVAAFPQYLVDTIWLCDELGLLDSFDGAIVTGETLIGYWNIQRGWIIMRVVSFLFGFIDTILIKLGITNSAFVVTVKTTDEYVLERYEKEVMDFSPSPPMLNILGIFVTIELFCFIGVIVKMMMMRCTTIILERLFLQFVMNGMMIAVNLPIYNALFFRRDGGSISFSVTLNSLIFAMFSCLLVMFLQ
ncbi:Cellulose synthase-like CSLE, family GT2 [Zostera marina]|uniref:Cellulose synthase-like CSLE, family GT2 n=1 Tax=Zostera marina TaxID=29655 RepID=A0A0K9NUR8_ZOSMR|nr:Cellulose synthase-like CSLE, family GT2 [Zostera marina]